ncbi:MAG: MFS transporter [Anaerolineales bacterium]
MSKNLVNIPFAPRRWPFFYGWFILAAGTIGFILSVPGQTIGISPFTKPLRETLGLSQTTLSLAYMVGTLASASLLTYAGHFYDRFGARVTSIAASIGMGLVLLYLSQAKGISNAASQLLSLQSSPYMPLVVLVLGFFLLRFFGQSMLTMASSNMIMKWFKAHRGLAGGIMNVFTPLGFSLAPQIFNHMNENKGWSKTWMLTALAVGLGFTLFAAVFYRDNPEDCGLQPDGKTRANAKETLNGWDGGIFTLPEARQTFSFWVFNLALALNALYITAITFHIESIFEQAGRTGAAAFRIFLPISFTSVALGLIVGWFSDYTKLKFLLMTMTAGMLASMLGILFLRSNFGYILIIIGNGVSQALFGLLLSITWPRFFGKKHLGAISGFQRTWMVSFSSLGPHLFSLSFENLGSYRLAVLLCALFTVLLFGTALLANKPSQPESSP